MRIVSFHLESSIFHDRDGTTVSSDLSSHDLAIFVERSPGSSAKRVVETVTENPARRRSLPARWASTLWRNSVRCRLRQRASRRIWIRTTSNQTAAAMREARSAANGHRHRGKGTECVARTPDAYIRRITDTSSTCLHDSPSAMSGQGRGVVVMAVMFVMLRILPPANCTSGCTPSCLVSSRYFCRRTI